MAGWEQGAAKGLGLLPARHGMGLPSSGPPFTPAAWPEELQPARPAARSPVFPHLWLPGLLVLPPFLAAAPWLLSAPPPPPLPAVRWWCLLLAHHSIQGSDNPLSWLPVGLCPELSWDSSPCVCTGLKCNLSTGKLPCVVDGLLKWLQAPDLNPIPCNVALKLLQFRKEGARTPTL